MGKIRIVFSQTPPVTLTVQSADATTTVLITDLIDKQEDIRVREDRMRDTLLQALLQKETAPQDNDLSDVQSIDYVACVEDDSSIDSINQLDNLLVETEEKDTLAITVHQDEMYHCVMWKTLSTMYTPEAFGFVNLISDAMMDLGMHDREKGVDSINTKQKTLILRGMVDRAPSNINTLSPDEKLSRNVIVKLFNKKGKSKKEGTKEKEKETKFS